MSNTYGHAGKSVVDGTGWAQVNKRGLTLAAQAERKTAAILDTASTFGGPATLHDLTLPKAGFRRLNIDHVLVTGKRVIIVDAKCWKPGRYVTVAGRTFRGFTRVRFAEKHSARMAVESIAELLASRTVSAQVSAVLCVHSSNSRSGLRLRLLRYPGARAMSPDQLARFVQRQRKAADPRIVAALRPLVRSAAVA